MRTKSSHKPHGPHVHAIQGGGSRHGGTTKPLLTFGVIIVSLNFMIYTNRSRSPAERGPSFWSAQHALKGSIQELERQTKAQAHKLKQQEQELARCNAENVGEQNPNMNVQSSPGFDPISACLSDTQRNGSG